MAKPVVKTIHAFDAHAAYTVEFTWSGNQAYNNRMIIYDAATQAPVYDHTYSNNYYRLNHEIPAYTLDNDKQYAVQVQVIDANGEYSALSDKYYFFTISTPLFYFDGLEEGVIIYSPSINLSLIYEQSGTETLTWVQYHLYDASQTPVTETTPDYGCTMTHTFRGLVNKAIYYVRATGVTVHGMSLDTGFISFSTSYQNPSAYARVYAEADPDTGFVNYYSNIVIISPDEDDYEYEDGYIDLTEINPTSMLLLHTITTPNASMDIDWTAIDGGRTTTKVTDSNRGIVLIDYKYVNKIVMKGSTTQDSSPRYLGDYHPIENVSNCTLMVNRIPIEDVTQGQLLSKLPIVGLDYLVIMPDGSRKIIHEVGQYRFSRSDRAVFTTVEDNNYVTYYDIGAMPKSAANNLLCSSVPVNNPISSTVSIDSETGLIKFIWRSDRGINTEEKVREFFRDNDVTLLFPLAKISMTILDEIAPMPSMENAKILRYSQGLRIPGDKTTFYLRMKNCRKTANFMKVYTDDKINFILSGRVDEENVFRLKLTVYGTGPKYIQYSDAIEMDYDDILTVVIRRDSDEISENEYKYNAIYGLYASVFESSDADYLNVWLGENKPEDTPALPTNDKDLWIDLDGDLVYIAEPDVVRLYQDEYPTDADVNTIWIGGDM